MLLGTINLIFFKKRMFTSIQYTVWMVYTQVVGARGLEYGGREFESRSLHLKPETKLREKRGLSGCRKGLKTVLLAQALSSSYSLQCNYFRYVIQQTCAKCHPAQF